MGWFLLAFAIFNSYMMFWSLRVNIAVFLVFLTLEITEILLLGAVQLKDGRLALNRRLLQRLVDEESPHSAHAS